jgi:thiol-disulfide isomerase/thioredoxin
VERYPNRLLKGLKLNAAKGGPFMSRPGNRKGFNPKRKYPVFILILAAGLLLAATYRVPGCLAARPEDLLNKPAPSFVVTDLNGARMNLNDLGKVILIDFWATWCGPCREIAPVIISLYETYSDQGLVVLGIAVNDTQRAVEKYVKDNGIPYPIIAAFSKDDTPLAKIVQDYGVRAIPTLVLVDKSGIVRHVSVGTGPDKAKFQKELGKLISDLLEGEAGK